MPEAKQIEWTASVEDGRLIDQIVDRATRERVIRARDRQPLAMDITGVHLNVHALDLQRLLDAPAESFEAELLVIQLQFDRDTAEFGADPDVLEYLLVTGDEIAAPDVPARYDTVYFQGPMCAARMTFRDDWDAGRPWVLYVNDTARYHAVTRAEGEALLKECGFSICDAKEAV